MLFSINRWLPKYMNISSEYHGGFRIVNCRRFIIAWSHLHPECKFTPATLPRRLLQQPSPEPCHCTWKPWTTGPYSRSSKDCRCSYQNDINQITRRKLCVHFGIQVAASLSRARSFRKRKGWLWSKQKENWQLVLDLDSAPWGTACKISG